MWKMDSTKKGMCDTQKTSPLQMSAPKIGCALGAENGSSGSQDDSFLRKLWPILLDKGLGPNTDRSGKVKVVDFVQPDELRKAFDFSLPEGPTESEAMLKICEAYIDKTVKTGHPHYYDTLYQGIDKMALAGAYLTETMNVTGYTYEVAPLALLMETEIINTVGRDFIGYAEPDGIFCPGGSTANFYGLNLARFRRFPEVKAKGMQGIPTCHVYTSDTSHYSMKKGVSFMGIGLDNLIEVESDSNGQMNVAALAAAIQNSKQNGAVPLVVNATSGTTVFGAFDPVDEIADVCQKEGLWLHVDGAWGGTVLMSDKLRYKMKGVERADSVTWDPHKMLSSQQQCSVFITKHKGLLRKAHCANADYLFQQDKIYDPSYDTGDISLQCGRKIDALKLWVQWKARGRKALAASVENLFELTRYSTEKLKNTPGIRMVVDEPECTNICFWYIPERLRGKEETAEWWKEVSLIAPGIKRGMQEQGTMLMCYQKQGNLVNFFRQIIANHSSTKEDMDVWINEIVRLGKDL